MRSQRTKTTTRSRQEKKSHGQDEKCDQSFVPLSNEHFARWRQNRHQKDEQLPVEVTAQVFSSQGHEISCLFDSDLSQLDGCLPYIVEPPDIFRISGVK